MNDEISFFSHVQRFGVLLILKNARQNGILVLLRVISSNVLTLVMDHGGWDV